MVVGFSAHHCVDDSPGVLANIGWRGSLVAETSMQAKELVCPACPAPSAQRPGKVIAGDNCCEITKGNSGLNSFRRPNNLGVETGDRSQSHRRNGKIVRQDLWVSS